MLSFFLKNFCQSYLVSIVTVLPLSAASCNGDDSNNTGLTEAPFSISNFTISECPLEAASQIGVAPSIFLEFTCVVRNMYRY
jgi:hypothetical protein